MFKFTCNQEIIKIKIQYFSHISWQKIKIIDNIHYWQDYEAKARSLLVHPHWGNLQQQGAQAILKLYYATPILRLYSTA